MAETIPVGARLWAAAGTVRVRTTGGAVLVVGVALLVGGVLLVASLRESLVNDRREIAEAQADEVIALLDATADPSSIMVPEVDDQVVQVVDANGVVVASSSNAAGALPIAQLAPGASAEVQPPLGDESAYIAVAVVHDAPGGQLTVLVARGLDDVVDSTDILTRLLLIGLPALLLVVAFTTWKVVGRALRPVDAIRREVDAISGRELHRRVPEPQHGDEISRLASTMNRMLGRLEDAQSSQRRFVSDAAHELRSPIASIRQHAEVAMAHPERASIGGLGETVLAEDLRLQSLVEDLLLLARSDEGSSSGVVGEVDLDDIVFEEAGRLRETSSLAVDTSAVSGGRVRGDASRLRRMVGNIVDNAARHARSRVVLSLAEQPGGSVLLRVDDDGAGIPVDDRERVFERFVRLDDGRSRDDGGSGLGLSIVAELAAAHGGAVVASESPIGGARIEIRLPAAVD